MELNLPAYLARAQDACAHPDKVDPRGPGGATICLGCALQACSDYEADQRRRATRPRDVFADNSDEQLLQLGDFADQCARRGDAVALRRGLGVAITIIRNYQADARDVHANERFGFCQGTAYLDAFRLILSEMGGKRNQGDKETQS